MSDSREAYLLKLYLDRTRRAARAGARAGLEPAGRERAAGRPRWARLLAWLRVRTTR